MFNLTITSTIDDYKRPTSNTKTYIFKTEKEAYEYLAHRLLQEVEWREMLEDQLELEQAEYLAKGDYKNFVRSAACWSLWEGEYVPTTLEWEVEEQKALLTKLSDEDRKTLQELVGKVKELFSDELEEAA